VAKQHLLLVDGDPKNLRVMEVSLKKAGFSVTTASDGKDALEKAQISPPDLVLSDTKMPGVDGFELLRSLKADERFKQIPFVFLTGQKSVEFKVKGLELGGEDYLTRPIYIKEIVTRLKMILQKAEKERFERRETKGGFLGSLADMNVVDLVQTFEMGRKTGTITIHNQRKGIIYFREGRVVDSELGRLGGELAFYRMLNASEGDFEVAFVPVERPERIEISTQGLLMEGMRRLDEWGRILEQIPSIETVFELDYRMLADRLAEIPDEVNALLRLFDGKRSLERVVDDSDFDDLNALGIISKLYFEGLLRESGVTQPTDVDTRPKMEEWLHPVPLPAPSPEPLPHVDEDHTPPIPIQLGAASVFRSDVDAAMADAEPELPKLELVRLPPPARAAPLSLVASAPDDPELASQQGAPADVVMFERRAQGQDTPAMGSPAVPGRAMDEARNKMFSDFEAEDGSWAPSRPVTSRPPSDDRSPLAPPVFGGAAVEPVLLTDAKDRMGEPHRTPPMGIPVPPEPAPARPEPARVAELEPEVTPRPLALPMTIAEPAVPAPDPVVIEPPAETHAGSSAAALSDSGAPRIIPGTIEEPASPPTSTVPPPPSNAALSDAGANRTFPSPVEAPASPPPAPASPPASVSAEPPVPAPRTPAASPPRSQAVVSAAIKAPDPVPKGRKGWLIAIPLGLVIAVGAYFLGRRSAVPVHPPGPVAQGPSTAASGKSPSEGPAPVVDQQVPPANAVTPVVAKHASPTNAVTPAVAKVKPSEGGTPGAVKQAPTEAVTPAVAKETPAESGTPAVAKQTAPDEGAQSVAKTEPDPTQPGAEAPPVSEFDSLMARAKAANQRTAYRTAAAAYRKALALQPDSLDAKSGLGIALVNGEGSYVDAARLLSEVVKARDQDERAWLALGMAYQFNGDQQSAFKAYRKYLELAPNGESAKDVKLLLQQPQ